MTLVMHDTRKMKPLTKKDIYEFKIGNSINPCPTDSVVRVKRVLSAKEWLKHYLLSADFVRNCGDRWTYGKIKQHIERIINEAINIK